jgi:capsular polysaccharide biosynthesis protein
LGGGRYSVWLADLPEAEVIGPSIAVVTRKKVLLGDVSVEWGRTSDDHGVMRRFRLPPAISLKGTSVLLATTGGDTYYHWMMEVLPRLLLLQEAGINLSRVDHFLVNGFQKRFQMESLEAVGIPVTKCRTTQGKCRYRCEQLLVPSLLGPHGGAQPDACRFLKTLFPGSGARKDRKRIFVPRGQTQGRKVRREDEILALLAEFKFESFDAGKVSLREQAETFACAEMVVGIHGGALTNLAFCTPGTRVVEIFGWRYVNPCYRSLASAVGAEHYAVLDMPKRRGPAITSFTSSSSDLEGNVEGLREMLEILV